MSKAQAPTQAPAPAQALQRILDVTRRFFEIDPAPRKPLPHAARSYPVPAPVAWRWCRGDDGDRHRWFHNEYPYGAADASRSRGSSDATI